MSDKENSAREFDGPPQRTLVFTGPPGVDKSTRIKGLFVAQQLMFELNVKRPQESGSETQAHSDVTSAHQNEPAAPAAPE